MVKSYKVLYVLPAIAREGITKVALQQIQALKKQEIDVCVVVLSNSSKDLLNEYNVKLRPDKLLVLNQGASYLSVGALLKSPFILSPILKFISRNEINVVIAHAPYAHFVMRLVKMLKSNVEPESKLCLWQYFHITQYAEYPVNSLKRLFINTLNKKLAQKYDTGHIYVSDSVKDDIAKGLRVQVRQKVLYNAIDKIAINKFFNKQDLSGLGADFTILIPGRVEPAKGQRFFIKVFSRFIKEHLFLPSQVKLLIAGNGSDRDKLLQEAESSDIVHHIHCIDEIENSALIKLMGKCSLILLPSFFEGLPLVLLEALEAKALVLASDIGPHKEVIKDGITGFLFKAGDEADCLAKLQHIYKNREKLLINFNEVDKLLQERFSFNHHIDQLVSIIKGSEGNNE